MSYTRTLVFLDYAFASEGTEMEPVAIVPVGVYSVERYHVLTWRGEELEEILSLMLL